jgi:glutamate-1-semialdehyde 2,1-aminomutase
MTRVVAIVQARMGSARLPNKVMQRINGVPMIELLLARLSAASEVDEILVATSVEPGNRPLVDHVRSLGYSCEQGSENDVLDRFVQAARAHRADVVVRITGDCPLLDPALVDECVRQFKSAGVEYLSNVSPPTYPDGLDVEVVTRAALERALRESSNPFDHEHVTPYVRESGLFAIAAVRNDEDLSASRWTVDEPADLDVVRRVFAHFAPEIRFTWQQIRDLQRNQPQLFAANQQLSRNAGATMGTGQKLWKRAKRIIPGGNMLLSKRAEMFLPEQWPAYFSRAKGCKVWDLDGNEYTDMSIMGIGTNTLGYGHDEVDAAVRKTIDAGNMSTFNCPEEVYLAEKLVEMHPWADMARFARTGGEANAIAIRIARAASGRDKVAICGYHGWHDWYLSANLGDGKELDGHLLPGLDPNGVPRSLKGTVLPFNYNRLDELEALFEAHDIGVIKMEVARNVGPEDDFLHKVRTLATQRNAVLIFDECTSGFRETFGGLHKKYGVEPDIALFGKALGNGYAIAAIIGRREVMEAAQSTFISSTFWTERIGPAAALKTLEVMERVQSWDTITRMGSEIRRRWQSLADKNGLSISHWGLPALTGFSFQSPQSLAYKTLITQEMLAKGYLAGNSVYVCIEHTPEVVARYFDALDPVFGLIRDCEDGRDVTSLLKGPVCHAGFKRLN